MFILNLLLQRTFNVFNWFYSFILYTQGKLFYAVYLFLCFDQYEGFCKHYPEAKVTGVSI